MFESVTNRVWNRLADRYRTNDDCECGFEIEKGQSNSELSEPDCGC